MTRDPFSARVARAAERSERGVEPDGLSPAGGEGRSPSLLSIIDAYWRAANYLTVGQIYLMIARHTRAVLEQREEVGCRSA